MLFNYCFNINVCNGHGHMLPRFPYCHIELECQVGPSIYHTWHYTSLLGGHIRECQLFRDWELSLVHMLFGNAGKLLQFSIYTILKYICVCVYILSRGRLAMESARFNVVSFLLLMHHQVKNLF